MELKLLFTFTFILAGVYCQISNELDVDDLKNKLKDHVDLSGFDESKLPQADELDLMFQNKCDAKSGNGTYEKVKESKDAFQECVSGFVNITVLREEVEESKKTGSMDEVFGKYCNKYPELSKCTYDFIDAIEPCLEDAEYKSMNTSLGLAQKMKDFVCHKNGDRIAMFVSEGGLECVSSQKDALQQCVNSTFGSRMGGEVNPSLLPVLTFGAEDCKDFQQLRSCISEALGHCSETTPSNLIDAFFKYLNKILPCAPQQNLKNDVSTIFPTMVSSLVSMAILVRFI